MGSTQVIESTVQHHLAPFCCLSVRAIEGHWMVDFVLSLNRPFEGPLWRFLTPSHNYQLSINVLMFSSLSNVDVIKIYHWRIHMVTFIYSGILFSYPYSLIVHSISNWICIYLSIFSKLTSSLSWIIHDLIIQNIWY